MKTCRQCGELKPASAYYKHGQMADGRLNKCKDCVKLRVTAHRWANIEKIREYDRSRQNLPHRIATRKRYFDWYCKHRKVERAAQIIVGNAIRDGRLEKGPCEICGSLKVHAHHPDYTKPLKVRWLCAPHHKAVHMGKIP